MLTALLHQNQVLQQQFQALLKRVDMHCAEVVSCEPQFAQNDGAKMCKIDVQNVGEAASESAELESGQSQELNEALSSIPLQHSLAPSRSLDVPAITPLSASTTLAQQPMQSGILPVQHSGSEPVQQLDWSGLGVAPQSVQQVESQVVTSFPDDFPLCVMSSLGNLRLSFLGVSVQDPATLMWRALTDDEIDGLSDSEQYQLTQLDMLQRSRLDVQQVFHEQQQQTMVQPFGVVGSEIQREIDVAEVGVSGGEFSGEFSGGFSGVQQPQQLGLDVSQQVETVLKKQIAQQPRVQFAQKPVGEASGKYPSLVPKEVKIEPPPPFTGRHHEIQNWMFLVRQYAETIDLGDTAVAVRFVATLLRGNALTWWRSFLDDNPNALSTLTLDQFFTQLSSHFVDLDRELKLRNALLALKQVGSVQSYTSQFRKLQLELGSAKLAPDVALHVYVQGLKQQTRQQVHFHRPTLLADAILMAERFDQTLQWSGSRPFCPFRPQYSSASQYSSVQTGGPSPMVLGNAQFQKRGGFSGRSGNFSRGGNAQHARGNGRFGGQRGGARDFGAGHQQQRFGGQQQQRSGGQTQVRCDHCGRFGHIRRDCISLQQQQKRGYSGPARGAPPPPPKN